jgi:hypothetical protein
VADGEDEHQDDVVVDFVVDAVVARTDSPFAGPSHESLGRGWAGVVGKEVQGGLDPAPGMRVELAEFPCGGDSVTE